MKNPQSIDSITRRGFCEVAALSIAASAFAQSSEKTKSASASANFPPIGDIHAHVCGIHFYSGDMSRQIIAEHYCSHLSDELLQCVIYDSNKPGARLIGIEYIVSAKIFESLPPEEKKLWHSHNYEVKSGVLTAPGVADAAEKDLMKVLIGTYGKTWHTWQVDRGDKLPMGIPQLMMAFTADGQAKASIVAERDKLYGASAAKKTARADIADAKLDSGADGWQKGEAVQLDLKTVAAARR
ncbi:MAG TPA: OBAP family protein [Candidatus Binatus sp.]|nr:OBAP family protein [Candidatus Binatus sp.]